MASEQVDRSLSASAEARLVDHVDGREHRTDETSVEVRPELIRLFQARWKRNEPGLRILAR